MVLVVVLIAALAYAQSGSGQNLLTKMGLKEKPTRYTALSFTHVEALPYSAITGSTQTFEVTLTNHRGRTVSYTLSATGSDSTEARGRVTVSVPDDASRNVDLKIAFRCSVPTSPTSTSSGASSSSPPLPTARVVVTASPSGESITHTMYCRARP